MKISTKKLVYMSFLIALSIILTRIFSIRIPIYGVEGFRIGFGGLPTIFAGIIFGPAAGGIVGAVADLLGYWVFPMGGYMPHFTLTAFLTGFIPGLMFHYILNNKWNYWTLLISIVVGQTITSIILVPVFLNVLFDLHLITILIPRVIGEPIYMFIYAYLIKVIAEYNIIKIPENSLNLKKL